MLSVDDVVAYLLASCSIVGGCATAVVLLAACSRLHSFEGRRYALAGPVSAGSPEDFFMSLHGVLERPLTRLLRGQPWVALQIVGRPDGLGLEVWIPHREASLVDALVRAAFPGAELSSVDAVEDGEGVVRLAPAKLAERNDLPIRTGFAAEPLL